MILLLLASDNTEVLLKDELLCLSFLSFSWLLSLRAQLLAMLKRLYSNESLNLQCNTP
jgi:hypothetical protein